MAEKRITHFIITLHPDNSIHMGNIRSPHQGIVNYATHQLFTARGSAASGGAFRRPDGRSLRRAQRAMGIYALGTQMVYREAGDGQRGLTLFGFATKSDPRTDTFRFFYVGCFYQGTFAHRDEDFISLLFAHGTFNNRLTRFQEDRNSVSPGEVGIQTNESVLEEDYGIAVAPWLQVRPNLQYAFRPGGTGNNPDAFVIGLTTKVTF